MTTRQQEIREIWKQYQGLYVMVGILIGLLLFPFLELIINDLTQLLIGIVPEAIGIGFTVIFLDRIYENRRQKEQIERDKQQANEQRYRDQLQAISELERATTPIERQPTLSRLSRGNLFQGIKLTGLNLDNCILDHVNLSGVHLTNTQLTEARLRYARLNRVSLSVANLTKANLTGAQLQGSDLSNANLKETKLSHANLEGAYLCWAGIENTIWNNAILPDGTKRTHATNMKRFTDPEHPEFDSTLDKVNNIRKKMRVEITQKGFNKN